MDVVNTLAVSILTFNEEVHLERVLRNVEAFADEIVIIDSYSQDGTLGIARKYNCKIVHRKFDNFASQRNFALQPSHYKSDWVLVLDADEYLSSELIQEINSKIRFGHPDFNGAYLNRRFIFNDVWLKKMYYPLYLLRLCRVGFVNCEPRVVNEHLHLSSGKAVRFKNDFVDHNLAGFDKWLRKHIGYADYESDLLLIKPDLPSTRSIKSALKLIYSIIPGRIRPIAYFFYLIVFKMGFMDGPQAIKYAIQDCFIYRYLIQFKYEHKIKQNSIKCNKS